MTILTFLLRKKITTLSLVVFVVVLGVFQFMPFAVEAGGAGIGGLPVGLLNLNLGLVDANGNYFAPVEPLPVITVTGTDQATWCWGTCYSGTNQQALDFVTMYIGLIIGEYGTTYGSVIQRDSAGRVIYIACANGGVVTVTYTADVTDMCPADAGVQTDPSQCSCIIADNGCKATHYTDETCFDGCKLVSGVLVRAAQTATLTASPTSVAPSGPSTLTYSCTASGSASIIPTVGGLPGTSGTVVVNPAISTTYTLNCFGASVVSTTADVTVVAGLPDITASTMAGPTSGTAGQTLTFNGTVSNIGTGAASTFNNHLEVRVWGTGATVADLAMNTLALAPGGSGTASASYTFASAGDYGVRVCGGMDTIGNFSLVESDNLNNCAPAYTHVTISPASAPDLSVSQPNTPISAVVGAPVTLRGTVDNTGSAVASPAFSSYFLIDGGTTRWTSPGITIPAGSSAAVTASLTYSFLTAGAHTVQLCADGANAVTESNEGNNCGSPTTVTVSAVGTPDLQVTQPSAPTTAVVSTPVTFTGRVDNTGGAVASPAFTSYFLIDGGTTRWTAPSITIPASSNSAVTASASYTFVTTGAHTVQLCADGTNAVTESDEGNNCGSPTTVTVSATPVPNLQVLQPVAPVTATVGTPVTFTGQVDNTGTAIASPAFTSYFLVDGVTYKWTAAGITIPAGSNSAVTAGSTYTFVTAGAHTVQLCADGTGVVAESNEGDNCNSTPTTVIVSGVAPPVVTLTTDQPSDSMASGGTAHLTWGSSGATTCTSASFATGNAISGTVAVSPSSTATYDVTCTGAGGSTTVYRTLTITGGACTMAGPIKLTASPSRVRKGQTTTLTWEVTDMPPTGCQIVGPGVSQGISPPSCAFATGSVPTPGLTKQSVYVLSCPGGKTAQTVVNVATNFWEF